MLRNEIQSKSVEIIGSGEYHFKLVKQIKKGGGTHCHGKAEHNTGAVTEHHLGRSRGMGTLEGTGVHPVPSGRGNSGVNGAQEIGAA